MLKTIDMKKPANLAESSIVLAIEQNENSSFIKGLVEAFYMMGMLSDLQHTELNKLIFEMSLQGR